MISREELEEEISLANWLGIGAARFVNGNDNRLISLYDVVHHQRATGRTYRLANEIINNFFNEPIGTKIDINDHYYDETHIGHYKACEMLARKVLTVLIMIFLI